MEKTLSNLQFNGFHKRKRCLSFSFQFHFSKNEPQSFFFKFYHSFINSFGARLNYLMYGYLSRNHIR